MNNGFLKWAMANRTGLGLTLAVVLFVGGWRLSVIVGGNQRRHWQAVATELGSLPQFKQDLSPNNAGTCLVYCQATEKGVGFYFCETGSGKSRLLCEQNEKGYSWQRYCMLGWSPDDQLFAYAIPLQTHPPDQPWMREEQIVICDGQTGETLAKTPADPDTYELAWLTPHSFAYSTAYNHDLRVVEKNQEGKWVLRQVFEKVTTNKLETLTAVSDKSVAWQDGENVWSFDFDSGLLKKVWDSGANANQLVDFTYARETRQFLLNCSDANGQFLIRFSPESKMAVDGGRIGNPLDFVSVVKDIQHQPGDWIAAWKRQGLIVMNVKWADNGPRYTCADYVRRIGDWPALCVKTKAQADLIHVPWNGFIENFALNGDHLFFTGGENGAIPGIWEYDIEAGTLRCVVSGSAPWLEYVKTATALTGTLTNAAGEAKTYYLWPPTHISSGKRYPLVITKQFWNWFPYDQIAANEGYFFAVVDETCVEKLPEILAKNINVDTKRVYLYESSAGTRFASELLANRSDLWRGAILFGPSVLPHPPLLQDKRLLLVAGMNDGDDFKRLTQYQVSAAQDGFPIALAFLNDSDHMPNSVASECRRALVFAQFLIED